MEEEMPVTTIKKAIIKVEDYFKTKLETGPRSDIRATAVMENGLRCCTRSPDGKAVHTDMSEAVGGTATANSPSWLLRAAIASCDATLLTMRAARKGIKLDSVEVNVDAMSDGRGLFLDEGVSPGSSEVRIQFRVGAKGVSTEQLQELVDWVINHSPVGTDIAQAVDVTVELEAV
jgi:uncharacterized OsmC-like protein